ncbi:MAG: DUF2254 family protein [Tepidiformaceae bacterium]
MTSNTERSHRSVRREMRQAFSEFLGLPVAIIAAFLVLSTGTYALDSAASGPTAPFRRFMEVHVLGDAASTSELLGTIAGSIITVTSITFSLLLIAVQQATSSFSHQVIDQFLRRRINQVSFGFFVGLALYALIAVATASDEFKPVYGATIALLLTVVALVLLLVLLYTTIAQMRPEEVIGSIHDRIVSSRTSQLQLLAMTRRASVYAAEPDARRRVFAPVEGYLVDIHARQVGTLAQDLGDGCEVEFLLPVGGYMACGDPIAAIAATNEDHATQLHEAVLTGVEAQRRREIQNDPGYGIQQLSDIAWTTGSTSKQNPSPALIVVRSLRDLLARWSDERDAAPRAEVLPVVYHDDVPEELFGAFEALIVVSSESMQDQVFAEVMGGFAIAFDRMPAAEQARTEETVLRSLAALGDLVLTRRLETALMALAHTLAAAGRYETAATMTFALAELRQSVGKLNSRATRVPGATQ